MKRTLTTLAAAALCSLSSTQAGTATADYSKRMDTPIVETRIGTGWYGGVFGGINIDQEADLDDEGGFDVDLEGDTGWFGGVKLGYVFDTRSSFFLPTFEVEAFYNGGHDTTIAFEDDDFGVDGESSGKFHSGVGMINAIMKFDLGRFRPYLGIGAGAAYVSLSGAEAEFNTPFGRTTFEGEDVEEWTFAYQAIAGFDFYFSDRLAVFAEYKALVYDEIEDAELDRYLHHLAGIGVRFHF